MSTHDYDPITPPYNSIARYVRMLGKTRVQEYPRHLSLKQPRVEDKPDVHQQASGLTTDDISIPENTS